jgi:signal transduction histidine kinase
VDRLARLRRFVACEIVDLGIPGGALSPEDMRRTRIISITSICMCAFAGVPTMVQFVHLDMPLLFGLVVMAVTAAMVNLFALRVLRRPRVAAHVGIAILGSLLVASNSMTGGFYDPNLSWLYVLPLAAAALIDIRGAAIWTALTIALTVGFWLLPDFGIVLVSQIPESSREGHALFNRVTAIFAIGVIAVSFVAGQRRAEKNLATANQDLLAETAYVHLLMHAAVAANEAQSFESAMRDSMRRICETMNWAAGHIYFVAEDGSLGTSGIMHVRDRRLDPLRSHAESHVYKKGVGTVGRAVALRRPQIIEAFTPSDDPNDPVSIAQQSGIQSAMAVPVFVNGDVPAVMLFAAASKIENTERLCEVFSLIGAQLGKVAERTALQERVQQTQKMEAVGQLAAGVAHEINNPMSYVRTNLHTLLEEWGELRSKIPSEDAERLSDFQELIEESLEGVERTIAIVRDVREFSHNGVVDRKQWETVLLSDVIDGARRVVASQAPSGVHIESDHEGEAPFRCSPNQIRQVFVNLIVNAIQAVGSKGKILLSTGCDENAVFARVEDDGAGMTETTRERLFDPFFTTKPVGEGTGLGLSVSYEIVRNHGGEILVSSEPGAGACFEVRLPSDPA